MTTPVRELLDEAAISDFPASLGSDVVAGARRRRRHRMVAATAGVAAALVFIGVVMPPGFGRRDADVVQPRPGQTAVVPRLIPPLGDHLPTLDDRTVTTASVAWTTPEPEGANDRLLVLDAVDGQAVEVTGQVYPESPVVLAPDGHAVAFVRGDCDGTRQSLGVFDLATKTEWSFGACDVQTAPDGRLDGSAIAWSADSRFVAVVAQVTGGSGVAVYDSSGAGQRRAMRVDARAVAWAPDGWAVRTADGQWQLRDIRGRRVGSLPELSPGVPAEAVAFSSDGRELARASWASGTWGYRIDTWPIDPRQRTTGGFDQALRGQDRWLVASGSRFMAVAGPFANASGAPGVGLDVEDDVPLTRVAQTVSRTEDRGLPVSLLGFTGSPPEQTVYALGVAGDLMVDPTFVATVPDDGHAWWESRLVWLALAGMVLAGGVTALVGRARRRPPLTASQS